MNVLALNGSPRMKSSSTWHILNPLLEGMRAAGAKTDVVHIRALDLNPCIGCYTCWVRTPGVCIHNDPMDEVLKQMENADLLIYGTPLYHFSMSGIMKTFIDRKLPVNEPWLVPHPNVPNVTGHPVRHERASKMLLVSPCGFPELDHFKSLVATFKHMAEMESQTYIGSILRPYAEPLSRKNLQSLFADFYEDVRVAGREIVETGRLSDETSANLSRQLFPGDKETLYKLADAHWTQQMDKFHVPEASRHVGEIKHIPPLLAKDFEATPYLPMETAPAGKDETQVLNRVIAETMAKMYNVGAIANLTATIQLHLMPPENGFDAGDTNWLITLTPEGATAIAARTPFPTLQIDTPHEVWRDIGLGKIEPVSAFAEGKYEVEGNMNLLREFPRLFNYPKITKDVNPERNEEKPMNIRSLSMSELLKEMAASLDADAAGDLKATFQFDVSGEEPGQHYIAVSDGKATYHEGATNAPTLIIKTPCEVWKQISSGELDGAQAFMSGKYKVEGDFGLLMRMRNLFKSA